MVGKAFGINRGRSNDDAQIGAALKQALQITEQKIDIQAAFVCLVDNQCVVAVELAIVMNLGQQNAVGHKLDHAVVGYAFIKPNLKTNLLAKLSLHLLCYPPCHAACGNPTWLRAANQTANTAPGLNRHFW